MKSANIIVNKDNTDIFAAELSRALSIGLEEIGFTAENYAMQELTEEKPHKSPPTPRGSIDTGRLRASITHNVMDDEKAVYIGTNVEYAPYVELGTSKAPAYPFLRPAIQKHIEEYRDILEKRLKDA